MNYHLTMQAIIFLVFIPAFKDATAGEPLIDSAHLVQALASGESETVDIQILMQQFTEGNHEERKALIQTFAKMGPKAYPALPVLLDALGEEHIEIEQALAAIGPTAAPALLEELTNSGDDYRRRTAKRALLMMGPDAAAQVVAAFEQDSWLPSYAATSITAIADVLKSASPHARRRAVIALGSADLSDTTGIQFNNDAAKWLMVGLEDSDPGVQALSAYFLGARRVGEAAPVLEALLQESQLESPVRREVSLALFRVDREPEELVRWREEVHIRGGEIPSIMLGTRVDVENCPDYEIGRTELATERAGFRHWNYRLHIGASEITLAKRYEPVEEKRSAPNSGAVLYSTPPEGFDPESASVGWLIPDRILCVQWSTMRNARFDVPADTTLLLLRDEDSWREIFRSSVPGYSGYVMVNSGSALHFDWNDKRQELYLDLVHSQFWGDGTTEPFSGKRLPLMVYGNGDKYHERSYATSSIWRCTVTKDGLVCGSGVGRLHVYTQEFALPEVVEFLHDTDSSITVERLLELNPWFANESRCTGTVVFGDTLPPYEPNGNHFYIWSKSE